ncbi:MAG: hypothetical protein JWM28_915 [Chitinophagaceae bacterium]|nr:hypothetical protein [Chitinophagaceae bacterium]
MQKVLSWMVLSFVVVIAHTQPERKNISNEKVIRITGTRLAYPLVQKWIDEYTKLNPGINITVSSKVDSGSVDIAIASHRLGAGDVKENQAGIAVARYIQLPVVNSRRRDLAFLQTKGFSDKDLRILYFGGNAVKTASDISSQFIVYKREKPACASIAFANHFGNEQKDISGVGVIGDDKDLLAAVKKDTNGISYNNLGFIYNIKTRRVVDSIAIIPIDLNENGRIDAKEKIYNTVDEVLDFTAKTKNPKIPVENVNVIFRKINPDKEVIAFLQWVLTKGQHYNREYGFLALEAAVVQSEEQLLDVSAGFHAPLRAGN